MKHVSPLEKHFGYWLRLISNQVSHSFARALEDQKVTTAEWVILRHLFQRVDTQPSVLSQETGLTKGAISKLIARLNKKGLVHRKNSLSDKRSEKINLTIKAQHLVPILARIADDNDKKFFSCLTKNEQRTLMALMMKLKEANKITGTPVE